MSLINDLSPEEEEALNSMVLRLTELGYKVTPPRNRFSVIEATSLVRRHQVVFERRGEVQVINKFWSWNKASRLAIKLEEIRKGSRYE